MAKKHPVVKDMINKMDKTIKHLDDEYKRFRTGRPSPLLFEEIKVDYYGVPTPINQVASLSVDGRMVVISPWDKTLCKTIEKAINSSDLGLRASTDGNVVRVNFPSPTTEDRKKWVKKAKEMLEDTKVALRNERREAVKIIKEKQKSGEIPEDDAKKIEEDIQKTLKDYENKAEELFKEKEKEIMEF